MKEKNKKPVILGPDIQTSIKKSRNIWFAQCPYCGKIFSSRLDQLKNGHTKSCGCLKKQKIKNNINIGIGDKINSLTILSISYRDQKGRIIYLCQCDCGNFCQVRRDNLISGNTKSCGCKKHISRGEQLITNLLIKNKIPFEKEKTFESCRFPDTKALARFDFYVKKKYLIEFDGQQHFKQGTGLYNNPKAFKKIQQHDFFKTNWCKQNNIPLIRIPYWKINSLTIKDLLI